jgi:hypothetical protein
MLISTDTKPQLVLATGDRKPVKCEERRVPMSRLELGSRNETLQIRQSYVVPWAGNLRQHKSHVFDELCAVPVLVHILYLNKKFWEELIACFHLIRHRPHIKRRVHKFFSIVACVFVAAVKFLPSRCLATTGIHIEAHRLTEGIYELRCWDGLRCHNIHTKFHEDLFRCARVDRVDI